MDATPFPKTVLAVDDDPGHLRLLELILGAHGYRVEPAQDGHEALALLQSLTPDAMIVDVEMPFMDGLALCRRVRRVRRLAGVPMLVMTASAREDLEVRAFAAGATRIVHKPMRGKDLGRIMRELLRDPSAAPPAL